MLFAILLVTVKTVCKHNTQNVNINQPTNNERTNDVKTTDRPTLDSTRSTALHSLNGSYQLQRNNHYVHSLQSVN